MDELQPISTLDVVDDPISYIEEITLDFNSNNAYAVVVAKQGDSGRFLKIYITKNNITYQIDPSHSFYFRMRKADGHSIINPAFARIQASSGSDPGYVLVPLTSQTLAAPGRGYADIVEYDASGNVISTIGFILNVMSRPDQENSIVSTDEYQQLAELLSEFDAKMQNAPAIDSTSKHWYQWSTAEPSGYYDTGIVAEGKDGNSYYIADVITGTVGSDVSITDTSAIFAGTTYYTNNTYTTEAGHATRIYPVINDISIVIGDTTYYVRPTDVQSSDEKHHFYVMSIPKGDKGDRGVPGEKGDIGAPGAGGVSWVDGIISNTERRYADASVCFSVASLSGWSYNNNVLSWTGDSAFNYDNARSYLKIGFSSSTNVPPDQFAEVSRWEVPVGGTNNVTALVFKENVTTVPSATDHSYFWGYQTEEAGNVHLQAVSYASQTNFISYNISGESSLTLITPAMQTMARANINAMKNVFGADGTAPTNGQLIGYVESDWQAINSEDILDELDYEDLLIITQNYAYVSAEAPAAAESNSANEGE